MPERQMMGKSQLHFVAILFPREISTEIRKYQINAARRFQSVKALNSPPHITLIPPFRWLTSQMADVFQTLEEISDSFKPFEISLNGFGNFSPRVIFISVAPNPVLFSLYGSLMEKYETQLQLSSRSGSGFHPHITIAYKDLKRERFHEAWEFFRNEQMDAEIVVDRIFLMMHDGHSWRVGKDFFFNSDRNENARDHLF